MTPLHQERCRRLSAAMGEAGCDAVLVYGNAWQCDYVRYVTDFPVIEGEAMALFLADGETQLFVESLGDADRARLQTPHVRVVSCDDLIDTVHGHPFIADGGPDMLFHLQFPRARTYRVFVQFQRLGVVNTVFFDIPVDEFGLF